MTQLLGNIGNARTPEQVAHMKATTEKGICCFCDINRNVNPVDLLVNYYWRGLENGWPYPYHMYHLVLPAIDHATSLRGIGDDRWYNGLALACDLVDEYRIPGGGIVLRSGEFIHHAGTLSHLHFQLQVPSRLGQSFATFGHPNETQVDETIAMLTGELRSPWQPHPVERTSDWLVLQNRAPRSYILQEFLIQPNDNLTFKELSKDPIKATGLLRVARWLEEQYKLPGFAVVIRFGQPEFNGREDPSISVKVIAAKGNGPVFEMFHPALNHAQAMCSMKHLVKKLPQKT